MAAANSTASVVASLHYYAPPEDANRPYQKAITDPVTGDLRLQTNWSPEEKFNIIIENIRGREDAVTLDTTGFQYFRHVSKHKSFANDDEIKAEYYPENVELIKKLTGATRVEIFDHTVRKSDPGQGRESMIYGPVSLVHIDQSSPASIARVHRHMPASEVPELLKKRFQILNLWRPIHRPAWDYPLALCDSRTVGPADVVPVTLLFTDREGELLVINYNEKHKWWYMPGMTPDDIVLFKCFDSIQDGSVAVFTPHTGFKDPSAPEGTMPRESIELRALVFYD